MVNFPAVWTARHYCYPPAVISCVRALINGWTKYRLHPRMIAEFDDSAINKAFGQEGAGTFIAPAAIEAEVEWQYQATAIGRVDEVKEHFFAISVDPRALHPVVSAVVEAARESLFSAV